MSTLLHWMLGLIVCAGSFGFIIFIHELGHYITAVRSGVYCPNFAIGFGPVIAGFRRWGTHFSVRLFPVGGYVQMVGEDPGSDQATWNQQLSTALADVQFPTTPRAILEQLPNEPELRDVRDHLANLPLDGVCKTFQDLDGNFNNRSVGKRMVIILGGVTMNFIAACLLMWFLGFTVGIGGVAQISTARVDDAIRNGAAATAGLKPGDVVTTLADVPILSGTELVQTVSKFPGKAIQLGYKRGPQNLKLDIVPDVKIGPSLCFSGRAKDVRVAFGGDSYGLAPGDVITALNGQPVSTPADLVAAAEAATPPLNLTVKDKPSVKLEGTKRQLHPEGRLGMVLSQVNSIGFIKGTTGEVLGVTPGSPAERAGFVAGDTIVTVNHLQILGGEELDKALRTLQQGNADEVNFTVVRGEDLKDLKLAERPAPSAQALGVQLQPVDAQMILTSPLKRISMCLQMPVMVIQALASKRMTAGELKKQSQGPIGMMHMLYEISDNGWAVVLWFLAFLNCAVGAFNLIPFPALDGMREVILLVGWLRGRNINPEKEAFFHLAGLALLLCLVVTITFQDIHNIWVGTPIMK